MPMEVTFAPGSPEELRLEGSLEKKSDYLGRFNMRHVRLGHDGTLLWYEDDQAVAAKGVVSLAHAEVATQDVPTGTDGEGSPKPPSTLLHVKVASQRGALIFRCTDAAARSEWAVAIREIAIKATTAKVQADEDKKRAEEERKRRAAEERRLRNYGVGLPSSPPAKADDELPDAVIDPNELPVKGTAALTTEEIAKLTDTEAIALESAMEEHKQRAQLTAGRAEKAAEELRKVREQQSGGTRSKELQLADLDVAAAELTKHNDQLLAVVAAEARSRAAINSTEGAARSAAERLGAQEDKRRAELKALEEEHAALLDAQKRERAELAAQLVAAKEATARADSSVNVALTMVELRKEQLAGLESLLSSKEHQRDVLMATLEGQKGSLLSATTSKEIVEAELASMIASAADVAALMIEKQNAERAAKLLAASKEQRLVAAQSAAADFASVMAAHGANSDDPSYTSSWYTEHAPGIADAVVTQLGAAKQEELARAQEAAAAVSLLKAKAAAAETAIGIKRGFVKDLVDAYDVAASEVAASEVAVAAAVELCGALNAQRAFIEEELTKLNETLVVERSASTEALRTIEGLRAEEKAKAITHEHATAAINALLVEERARAAVLAEKRIPATLPADSVVFISVPKEEEAAYSSLAAEDVPLPSLLSGAVDEVATRLATLADMREVVLRDYAVDAKQLAAVATQATAKEALAAAETAAQARACAALERYEAALDK